MACRANVSFASPLSDRILIDYCVHVGASGKKKSSGLPLGLNHRPPRAKAHRGVASHVNGGRALVSLAKGGYIACSAGVNCCFLGNMSVDVLSRARYFGRIDMESVMRKMMHQAGYSSWAADRPGWVRLGQAGLRKSVKDVEQNSVKPLNYPEP
jgi:hypothetical protein